LQEFNQRNWRILVGRSNAGQGEGTAAQNSGSRNGRNAILGQDDLQSTAAHAGLKPNPADHPEQWNIDRLIPYAKNSRTHNDAQVAQIAASIKEWGWTNPILVDEAGLIIAGHGRVMAARKLGIETVPVVIATGWTEEQKRAYVIADNKLAINAGWDEDLLKLELLELENLGFDIELTGFSDADIEKYKQDKVESDEYTKKIEVPTYEPSEKLPALAELYDTKKTDQLCTEIAQSNFDPGLKDFLRAAAQRHTIFNFAKIADYYANSEAEIQHLMERSALVLIDYDKAVENGFLRLTKKIMEQYRDEATKAKYAKTLEEVSGIE